jgi:hypothetical protein
MERSHCKVEGCKTEGGRFVQKGDGWVCEFHNSSAYRDTAKGFESFVSTHIDGKGTPIQVQSLRQLRKLENAYGVASAPYNYDHNNLQRG